MTDGMIDGTTVRLTYAELATARGISLDAARRLVLRKRWPKQIGNDGLTRASVPVEYAEPVGRDIGTDDGEIIAPDDGTDTAVILDESSVIAVAKAVLDGMTDVRTVLPLQEKTIAGLMAQLDAERTRADGERDRANRAETGAREMQAAIEEQAAEHRRV